MKCLDVKMQEAIRFNEDAQKYCPEDLQYEVEYFLNNNLSELYNLESKLVYYGATV